MLPIRVLLKSALVGSLLYLLPHGLSHMENLQSDKGLNGEDAVDHIQDREEQEERRDMREEEKDITDKEEKTWVLRPYRVTSGQQARLASDLPSLKVIFMSPNLVSANYTIKGRPNTITQTSLSTIRPVLALKHHIKQISTPSIYKQPLEK